MREQKLAQQDKRGGIKRTNKWLALVTTSVGTLMSTLNASIVTIANPVLASDFGISMAQVQWVSTTYLIITCSLMLLFGRIGDRIGAHKVYITGIAIFTIGSLACANVASFVPLLLARAMQGLGASMTVAVSLGMVATIFPLEQRGRAMGVTVLMVGLGNVAGPAVGGFILAHASWNYVFLLSVPFGVAAFIMAAFWLRSPLPKNQGLSVGLQGSVFFIATVSCLVVFLTGGFEGQEWFGLAFVVLLILLVLTERRKKDPLLEPSLFKNRRFILGNVIALLSYIAYTMLIFQLPFFMDTVWVIPVGSVGLLMMVGALALAVSGPASGFVSDRIGAFRVMIPALGALCLCFIAAFSWGTTESIGLFVMVMILGGGGMGFLGTPNNSDIMTAAGRENASYASGFVGTNRNLGFCIGTALSASVFSSGNRLLELFSDITVTNTETLALDHVFSFRIVLIVCLLLILLSLAICLYLARKNSTDQRKKQD